MKRSDSTNQLEKWLQSKSVPKVDVKEKVMGKIYAQKNQMEVVKVKKRIGLFVSVGLLVGATTVFAAVEAIQIKNEKGEVVYEVSPTPDQEALKQQLSPEQRKQLEQMEDESKRTEKLLNDILDGVGPGKAVAIYIKPNIPKTGETVYLAKGVKSEDVDVVSTGFEFTKLSDMQQKIGNKFTLPAELPGGFLFSAGDLRFEPGDNYDPAAMAEEAKKNNKEYVVKELQLTDKMEESVVFYRGSKGTIRAHINEIDKKELDGPPSVGGDFAHLEKVKIGDIEGVYSVMKLPEGEKGQGSHIISWINNGATLTYSIWASPEKVTKEELIKAAESLAQAK